MGDVATDNGADAPEQATLAGSEYQKWNERPLPFQDAVRQFYDDDRVALFVACLIMGNFGVQIIQMQLDPWAGGPRGKYNALWQASETFFNIAFLVELLINLYGRWFRRFLDSYWNYFDVVVVAVGVLDMCPIELYGPLKMLRMMRAFRVFRLFGKVESLRRILKSLQRALPGVVNSFLMILLMMAIYAVLAVAFFKDVYADCHDGSHDGERYFGETPRGKCVGKEYYGKFSLALYTLFQILTGESWSEFCVRPLLVYFQDSVSSTFGVAVFFISFILINSWVLLNVVVAVLLDGMTKAKGDPAEGDQDGEAKKDPRQELDKVRKEIRVMKERLETTKDMVNGKLTDVMVALKSNPTLLSRPAT